MKRDARAGSVPSVSLPARTFSTSGPRSCLLSGIPHMGPGGPALAKRSTVRRGTSATRLHTPAHQRLGASEHTRQPPRRARPVTAVTGFAHFLSTNPRQWGEPVRGYPSQWLPGHCSDQERGRYHSCPLRSAEMHAVPEGSAQITECKTRQPKRTKVPDLPRFSADEFPDTGGWSPERPVRGPLVCRGGNVAHSTSRAASHLGMVALSDSAAIRRSARGCSARSCRMNR